MARGPRALRHVENQPTAHRACTARSGLGAVACAANSRRAPPHAVGRGSWRRHRARSAAAASDRRGHHFLVPWRAARARVAPWRTIQPATTHTLSAACLARLSARQTRNALHPTPLTEAPLRRHRDLSAAVASNRRGRLLLIPWRAARARFVTWRTRRPPIAHLSLRAACLARLSARPRSNPRRRPRLICTDTAPGQRMQLRTFVSVSFTSRGARRASHRHVENQPIAHRALVSARYLLGAVVCAANSRRAPPHAVGRGASPPTPRSVGGTVAS